MESRATRRRSREKSAARKKFLACLAAGAAVAVMGAASAPALGFGHTATPAGQCAQSPMAADNPTAQAANPFSDANPIPARSGFAQPRC